MIRTAMLVAVTLPLTLGVPMADQAAAADPWDKAVTVETIDPATRRVVETFKGVPAWRNEKTGKWELKASAVSDGVKAGDRFTHEGRTYTIVKATKGSHMGKPAWLCEVR